MLRVSGVVLVMPRVPGAFLGTEPANCAIVPKTD